MAGSEKKVVPSPLESDYFCCDVPSSSPEYIGCEETSCSSTTDFTSVGIYSKSQIQKQLFDSAFDDVDQEEEEALLTLKHSLPPMKQSFSDMTREASSSSFYSSASSCSAGSLIQYSNELEDNNKKHQSTFTRGMALVLIALVLAVVCSGDGSSKVATRAKLVQSQQEIRELRQTQQALMLQLSKDKRIPLDQEHLTALKNPSHSAATTIDIVARVQLLQGQLEETSKALELEQGKLSNAEADASKALDQVSLLTQELSYAESQMQQDQGLMYRNLALQQFGAGPHYAEFVVELPVITAPDGNGFAVTKSFSIEFAPLDVMPASVYMFMRQVDGGLWDNTTFHLNAPHVLMAQPVNSDGDSSKSFDRMEELGLARIPFAEYSERFPHEQYTLGLGGRVLPGPHFFINKIDNSNHHQDQPCFAKVVEGFEVVDELGLLKGLDEKDPFYIPQVVISSVKLVQRN